jgi:hypothetical protein
MPSSRPRQVSPVNQPSIAFGSTASERTYAVEYRMLATEGRIESGSRCVTTTRASG